MKKLQCLTFIIGLSVSLTAYAQDKQSMDQLLAKVGEGFVSSMEKVNGTTLHFIRGGHGPAVILIHGFPQDWYEYHRVMPLLAKKFTVIAVDLRGIGGSLPAAGGYDAPNLAEDIHQLVQQLKLERVYVVGHDIGGMVAYAFARLYPKLTRGAMILDVPLPGMEPWDEAIAPPSFWILNFHQTPGLPEKLVTGRQSIYLHYILDPFHFSAGDVEHYASAYGTVAHLHAGFELYRAFRANGVFNDAHKEPLEVPLVWAAGDHSFFGKIGPGIAKALRDHGCRNVTTDSIKNSKHFLVNDQPESVAALIDRYASH